MADCVIQCKNLSHDITCMQEVRQKGEGFNDSILKGWCIIYNGMKMVKVGIAILLTPCVRLLNVNHIVEGRVTMVQVTVHGMKLSVFSCYCPAVELPPPANNRFIKRSIKQYERLRPNIPAFKIIAAGDFSPTIGPDCDPSRWQSVDQFSDNNPTSFNGSWLIETSESHNLYLLNTMFATKSDGHTCSFISNLGYSGDSTT